MTKPNLKKFSTDPLAFFDALVIPSAVGNKRFEDVMAPHQREWFEAVAPSLLAVASWKKPPVPRFWTERTKGASKDSDTACVLLWLLAFSKQKLDMEVGASDKDQANELKKAAADILRNNAWLSERIEVQQWTLICKATSSQCSILASDIAGSHGSRPDIVVMNELSHVTKEEFSQNLLDNASKKPNGIVIVATNAGFAGSWQESWRRIAQESPRWHFNQFSAPAHWLSDEEIEEAERRNSNARFQRLFWGSWVSQTGDFLDDDDLQASIVYSEPPEKQSDEFAVAGLDLGIKHDHSALVVIAGNRKTMQLKLLNAESWKPGLKTKRVDLIKVEQAIIEANDEYELEVVGYDPYQAELMSQRLEQRNVPMQEMKFTGANLNLMASTMLDIFRSRRMELYDHPQLIEDLSRLCIEEKSYGHRLTATRNKSGHADIATALAIALPIAVEELGTVPIHAGVFGPNTPIRAEGHSPYDGLQKEIKRRQNLYEAEQKYHQSIVENEHELPGWRDGMRRLGRNFS